MRFIILLSLTLSCKNEPNESSELRTIQSQTQSQNSYRVLEEEQTPFEALTDIVDCGEFYQITWFCPLNWDETQSRYQVDRAMEFFVLKNFLSHLSNTTNYDLGRLEQWNCGINYSISGPFFQAAHDSNLGESPECVQEDNDEEEILEDEA